MVSLNSMLPYNDDDEEDGELKRKSVATDDEFEGFEIFPPPAAQIPESKSSAEDSESEPLDKKPKLERTVTATRLVSYGADDYDDADRDSNADPLDFNRGEDSDSDSIIQNEEKISREELNRSISRSLNHSLSEEDIVIPPEPPGNCSRRLQEKVAKLYDKVLRTGQDMNAMIQKRKDFRNPSIYEKLIEFCGIDEKGTNYPPELFNFAIYGAESHYEELAKVQKLDMDRREKEKKEKKEKSLTVERIQGTKKAASKWDSVSSATTSTTTNTTSAPAASISSNLVQISATGPLPKQKIIS